MANTEFHAFSQLPPEFRRQIWEEALGDAPCLHAIFSKVVATRPVIRPPAIKFYSDHRYCQSELKYVSPEPWFKPELKLRLVNQEARRVVDRHCKDFQKISVVHQGVDKPVVVGVNIYKDMFYLMSPNHSMLALTMPLKENNQLSHGLRHLALPLFDIAYWPGEDERKFHDPSLHLANSPWLLDGFSLALKELLRLETIRLVIGRLFSVPFGVPYRRIKRRDISGSTALITTRTQLRDLAKSQPRDAYGFSDYTSFVATGGYQWPIDFPLTLFHPPQQPKPTPLPGPSGTTELPFDTYDPFFHEVLGELRRLTSPPNYPQRRVRVRLVVDLDSSANGAGPLMRPRDYQEDIPAAARHENRRVLKYGEYRDEPTPGYDRYFASSRLVLDWYEDVSGHARSIKGHENSTKAERDADDPDFEPTESELANLSDGSGPDAAYEAPEQTRKPRVVNKKSTDKKNTGRKTVKPAKLSKKAGEESNDCPKYLPPDYSEDDLTSDSD